MTETERFRKQLDFILELDKEKNIFRQTHLTDGGRNENDAEHAWHMAIMVWLLAEYANEKIDTGDTYAYDKAGKATEAERERKAADRLYSLLPEDQGKTLRALWEEFEAYETPESRFAHTMDNFQPLLLNASNDGGDWREHGIAQSQVRERNARTGTGSEAIWSYMQTIIEDHVKRGSLKDA